MAPSKNNKTPPRARLAHKLAKYLRATPIHLPTSLSSQNPSLNHLSNLLSYSALGGAPKSRLRNNANTWYPADDQSKLYQSKNTHPQKSTGRASVQPGNVVILLSGRHRGRRVVVLKSLPSGNLLVTGPYAVNGVPLKRVNPAYVIATSTKVSLEGVNANVDDAWFKRQRSWTQSQLKNASEAKLKRVEQSKQAEVQWKATAKTTQKQVDAKLLENIKKVDQLKGYLGTRFTLYNNSTPHTLVF
jgi:large subunit ribosomal protein L6e